MNLSLRAAVMSLAVTLLSPALAAAQGAAPDAPFAAVATAWQDAWNRHDMDALSDLVAEDVDFITVGGRWLKGREAFKQHHTRVHSAAVFGEASVEIRASHVKRLSPEVVLMLVEHVVRGDRNPDGTPRPARGEGVFTWILMQSGGRWRVRASTNTVPGVLPGTIAAQPLYARTEPAHSVPTATADTPFVASAMAWRNAWNRDDMKALGDIVADDIDFVSVGVPWLKGRAAFTTQVQQLRTTVFDVIDIRATHVQRLAPEVVLMHVEWTAAADRRADGATGPPARDGMFTWILTPSGGGWRVRAATNTVVTLPPPQSK